MSTIEIENTSPATTDEAFQEALKKDEALFQRQLISSAGAATLSQVTQTLGAAAPSLNAAPSPLAEAPGPQAPDLSDYMDYRKFLEDFYLYKKAATASSYRPYNYQTFSAAADIKSPNYLKMIIEGQRNLSEEMISKFAKAMGLNKVAAEEFKWLVLLNQASDPAERNLYLKKLTEHRFDSQIKSGQIDRKTWDKIPNWVTWVMYALIDQEGVSFDTKSLKEILRGKASDEQINHAIESLISSGELVRNEEGTLVKGTPMAESGEDVPVALVRKLQTQLMYLGLESLYQDQPTEREFGTLTLSLTQSEFEEIKFKLRQLRKALHKDTAISRMKEKGERVYQLNLQLFPVTNPSLHQAASKKD